MKTNLKMNRENKLNFLQQTLLANYISNYCSMIAKSVAKISQG